MSQWGDDGYAEGRGSGKGVEATVERLRLKSIKTRVSVCVN